MRDRHAGRARFSERPAGVVRFDFDGHADFHARSRALQFGGEDQRVAAVVAGARNDPDRLGGFGRTVLRESALAGSCAAAWPARAISVCGRQSGGSLVFKRSADR